MALVFRSLLLWNTFTTLSAAVPEVAFPFNSQVPAIPRVNQPYSYQLSPSTFSPSAADFVYSLSQQPAWLQIDSITRTLQGTPGSADAGPATFTLTAADSGGGAAHMECTLVVSTDPAPQLQGDISQQLSASANLSSADPAIVTLLPSTAFKFDFQQASFIDIVPRRLYYYATLADRTPLPAWLNFNAGSGSLTFSGTAPQLSSFPQSFNISLIASDVEGFAGASAYFTIVIGTRQLAFVPDEQDISVKPGQQFTMTGLAEGLYLNGMQLSPNEIAAVSSTVPTWLTVDSQTLAVSGRAPDDASSGRYTITVTDKMGDAATMSLHIDTSGVDLLNGNIGTLTAYAGQDFDYVIPTSMMGESDLTLDMNLPPEADWLSFDAKDRELSGRVPSSVSAGIMQATLTASSNGEVESQKFAINVRASIVTSTSSSSKPTPTAGTGPASTTTDISSATSRTPSEAIANKATTRSHLRPGVIAAIVISVLVGIAVLAAALILCRRRRKHRAQNYVDYLPSPGSSRRDISRPIIHPDTDAIMVTTDLHRDVEKQAGSDGSGSRSASAHSKRSEMTEASQAPQLALKVPRHSARASKWSARLSKISQVSSIGDGGEDAIKGDSNIPEWGRTPDLAANRDAHHSFSLPAEIARASRQAAERSPRKRAANKRRGRHQARKSNAGLGISDGHSRSASRHHSRQGNDSHKRKRSSIGLSATLDRSSVGTTSTATRGTSVLSAKPSTSEFPRPPSSSICRTSGRYSAARLSMLELDQGRSIRLVGRRDSVRDTRSLAEKRQSFIRNRASTTIESPLFAHGSRAPSVSKRSTSRSTSHYTSTTSDNFSRPTDSHLHTFSESSSVVDPPLRNPRRLSARVKSAFPPDYPRPVTETTLGATTDDWRTVSEHGSHSSGFYTTSESDEQKSQNDLAAQMALPRCQRSWVLPGEASPTPPPAPPASRQSSVGQQNRNAMSARERLKKRLNRDSNGQITDHGISSSPLSTSIIATSEERHEASPMPRRPSEARTRNRLSEPLSLVSADSLNHGKGARMRLLHAASARRPVSVDDVQRLSSMKAEPETDTQAGSENWEDIEAEVRSRKSKERLRHSSSGPAFL